MTDEDGALPTQGWYEDPDHPGMERFWDGETWTDEFRSPPTSAPPPVIATKSSATTVFVLGIMALIPARGLFNGAAAWWMGRRELREIDAGLRAPEGRKKAVMGRRLGMVGTLVWGPLLAIGLGSVLLSDSTLLEDDSVHRRRRSPLTATDSWTW